MVDKQTELRVALLDFMDELCPVIVTLCDNLRDYDLSGIDALVDTAEGLKTLIIHTDALNKMLDLGLDEETQAIKTQLSEITEAVENSDFLFLADILEFDVIENMEKIYNTIRDA